MITLKLFSYEIPSTKLLMEKKAKFNSISYSIIIIFIISLNNILFIFQLYCGQFMGKDHMLCGGSDNNMIRIIDRTSLAVSFVYVKSFTSVILQRDLFSSVRY